MILFCQRHQACGLGLDLGLAIRIHLTLRVVQGNSEGDKVWRQSRVSVFFPLSEMKGTPLPPSVCFPNVAFLGTAVAEKTYFLP